MITSKDSAADSKIAKTLAIAQRQPDATDAGSPKQKNNVAASKSGTARSSSGAVFSAMAARY